MKKGSKKEKREDFKLTDEQYEYIFDFLARRTFEEKLYVLLDLLGTADAMTTYVHKYKKMLFPLRSSFDGKAIDTVSDASTIEKNAMPLYVKSAMIGLGFVAVDGMYEAGENVLRSTSFFHQLDDDEVKDHALGKLSNDTAPGLALPRYDSLFFNAYYAISLTYSKPINIDALIRESQDKYNSAVRNGRK
ncbi:MAG: hypothetical protein MI867_12520 [Pseudomonadales bacterium]|nr:hypothetical protein [Pseudomonadales bacterium]